MDKLTKIVSFLLSILLCILAIGHITHQEQLSFHLVEIGLFTFKLSRVIVFVLPGIELICAIIVLANLSALSWIKYLLLSLVGLFLIDHMISFQHHDSTQMFFAGLINPWNNAPLDTLFLSPNFLILVINALLVGTLFQSDLDYFKPKPYVYFSLILLTPIGIVDQPIYRNDFQSVQSEIPETTSAEKIYQIIGNDYENCAVVFLSASCDACMQASALLGILTREHKTIPIILVFKSSEGTIKLFLEKSNNTQSDFVNLDQNLDLDAIIGRGVPTALLIKNAKIIDTRKGIYLNYQFLDKLLK